MNKYWKYVLFPRFLDDIRDCTFDNYEDDDLREILNNMVIKAIQDFPFCKYSLEYAEDETYDSLDTSTYGYYFVDDRIGEPEYNVLLTLMKVHWVNTQITWDNNFKNPFYDKDIKGYSPANMLTAMRGLLEQYKDEAKQAKFDYNRITKEGKVAWGQINHGD